MEAIRALVEANVKALVDEPERVKVGMAEGSVASVLEVSVAPSDMGKVIGKQGKNAEALRILLGAWSMKYHRRYSLEILEAAPDVTTRSR